MQIKILAIGKIKEDYLKRGIGHYISRISKFARISVIEIPEEDISSAPPNLVMAGEAKKIIKQLPRQDSWYTIVLDRKGEEFSSEQMAARIDSLMVQGKSKIVFIIGGALGLDRSVIEASDLRISLSQLTFTHQMARFILSEQIYRALKIINREPYHY
ncbi:MAG: 23S rRNA (pseudouridine(1915)-N(3))-methyltransferase RlmH [Rubrobacteridae bacterium]|nr:23S rRNA (pseudouridine(1915)-N(3))-methyltransferase RlmH [Rubrobacteridae bacterium]